MKGKEKEKGRKKKVKETNDWFLVHSSLAGGRRLKERKGNRDKKGKKRKQKKTKENKRKQKKTKENKRK